MAFTRELAEKALEVIRETGSLRQACLRLGFDRRAFTKLCDEDSEFDAAYARAKADGIDNLVEETPEIADAPPPLTAFGSVDSGAISHAKLRIETRRWLAERMAPRKYGVLQKLDLTSSDGSMTPVDTPARAARVAELMALAQKRSTDDADGLV